MGRLGSPSLGSKGVYDSSIEDDLSWPGLSAMTNDNATSSFQAFASSICNLYVVPAVLVSHFPSMVTRSSIP